MTLIILAIAWLVGIFVADQFMPPVILLQLFAVGGGLGAVLFGRLPRVRLVALIVCCSALGGWRYEASLLPTGPQSVRRLASAGPLLLQGQVHADPKRTEEGQQVILAAQAARVGGRSGPAEGLVLLVLPPFPEYRYGQRLMLEGELERPRAAEQPGLFDYRAYLERRGIFVLMREPKQVRLLEGERGNPALAALLTFRDHCKRVLMRMLPEPQSALAIGILLGLQSSVPDEVQAAFSASGTSHILVVSGWNFTIVAAILAGLAGRLGLSERAAFWPSLAVMWIYALFVGAGAAVLRAAAMASLVLLAGATERRSEPWTLLLGACWALTALDPNALWDLGFQLSALATASLFAFGSPTGALVARIPPFGHPIAAPFHEALSATLAAQVLTLPLMLYNFGNLSLIAPLANVVVVPAVPYAMLFGSLALMAGLAWLPLGQWAALLAWLPLSWIAGGSQWLAGVPFAAVQLPPFPIWMLLAYYAGIAGVWGWHVTR